MTPQVSSLHAGVYLSLGVKAQKVQLKHCCVHGFTSTCSVYLYNLQHMQLLKCAQRLLPLPVPPLTHLPSHLLLKPSVPALPPPPAPKLLVLGISLLSPKW